MNRIRDLRLERNMTMREVAQKLKIPYTTYVNYEKGLREPNSEMLIKIANFHGVTIDYLLGNVNDPFLRADYIGSAAEINDISEYEKAPTLTKKDERDIAKSLESIMADLEHSGDLMFDGDPMTEEARQSMRNAIELGLKAVKLLNKETYNPNKNKKG